MRILSNESKRWKMIGLTRRRLLRTSGGQEGLYYNVVILRHITGFLMYIDRSIWDTRDVMMVAVDSEEVLRVR